MILSKLKMFFKKKHEKNNVSPIKEFQISWFIDYETQMLSYFDHNTRNIYEVKMNCRKYSYDEVIRMQKIVNPKW